MNGRKAKFLRRLAGYQVNGSETKCSAVPKTRRLHDVPALNEAGGAVLDMQGKPVIIGQMETKTMRLNQCARGVYKALKQGYKMFKGGKRAFS